MMSADIYCESFVVGVDVDALGPQRDKCKSAAVRYATLQMTLEVLQNYFLRAVKLKV